MDRSFNKFHMIKLVLIIIIDLISQPIINTFKEQMSDHLVK